MRTLDTDGVEERQQVLDVVADLKRVTGLVGVAVAQHVDRPRREMLGVRFEVADIRLSVTAGTVQQDQRRRGRITGMQIAGPHTAGIQIALCE